MLADLFKKITPNTLILTANSRLALYLQSAFDEMQREKRVWETVQIMPLGNWLQALFYRNNTQGLILLNDFQEQCIWETIIGQSKQAPDLLHPTQLAKLVKDAWEIITLWQVPIEALEPFVEQTEVSCLIEWMNLFRAECQEKKWITNAELPQKIQWQDSQKPLLLPPKIILIGFDDLNPSVQNLLTQFKKQILIETETLSESNPLTQQIILSDTETELETMARWIKTQWQKNPAAKLGCVVPELGKMRAQVERIFTDIFCIEKIVPGSTAECIPFNISAGTSLAHHPMIKTVLELFNGCNHPISIYKLASLLQSPYLCATESDACVGAQMEALLREQNRLQVSLTDLYSVIPAASAHHQPWRTLLQFSREKSAVELIPSEWVNQFMIVLKAIHWPGKRTQSSEEFQALERFKKLLREFSQLDLINGKMTLRRAVQLLNSLAQQTIFQPKSHHEPIQIMGVLEASGILFDAVWVMGLHDGIWPPATKPHPLIPYSIQQHYQMPHATAERELQFCEHITKRLENSAKHVIFSSPAALNDQLLFPSRLMNHIPLISSEELVLDNTKNYAETLFEARKIETYIDDQAPAVLDYKTIHGGSNILKLQAQCPFRAFATIRLKAKALNDPVIGIPVVIKGIIIHQVLFEIWEYLKDQNTLLALTEEALDALIQQKIEKTFITQLAKTESKENSYFFSIEKKRLQLLIKNWLTHEKSRPAFRIKSLEESCQIHINQLPLKIRLDRVDELTDGSLLLIDYKTGENNIETLLEERLTNPQLPIYAAFQNEKEENYSAVAFAEVRNAKLIFKGLAHEKQMIPKTNQFKFHAIHEIKNALHIDSWEKLLTNWKNSLAQLATDFCNGNAIVNPIDKNVCESCDLKPVCRYKG